MELQPSMQDINHAQGKSGIPEGTMGILHGETSHEFYHISRVNKENLRSIAFGENKETAKARDIAVRYT